MGARTSYACLSATTTSAMGSQSQSCCTGSGELWRTLRMYSRNSSRSISFTMRSYALPCRETTSRMAAAAFLRAASLACLDTGACLAAAFLSAFAAFLSAAFAAFLALPATTGWTVARDACGGVIGAQ